jgi:hypothetical protein
MYFMFQILVFSQLDRKCFFITFKKVIIASVPVFLNCDTFNHKSDTYLNLNQSVRKN